MAVDVLESKSAELRSQHLELSLKQKKITQQYDESLAALSAAQQQYKELDARFRAKTQLERELKEKLEEAESQVITLLRGTWQFNTLGFIACSSLVLICVRTRE